ncbi:RP1/RP1L1/DCX like protein [Aduncisulcus paluster]|uniref:RP1/RP1L1/DCX like protein n=1 Tax=Aduncisulcus paluster TaxID=2918883 RepID=A0ABQ5KNZ7_9EUKA|nr:RP1/RP1L1/DCX like protein [Aduncisulcus paluster]
MSDRYHFESHYGSDRCFYDKNNCLVRVSDIDMMGSSTMVPQEVPFHIPPITPVTLRHMPHYFSINPCFPDPHPRMHPERPIHQSRMLPYPENFFDEMDFTRQQYPPVSQTYSSVIPEIPLPSTIPEIPLPSTIPEIPDLECIEVEQPMEIESAKPSKPPLTTRKSSRQKSKTLSTKPEESKPKPKPKPKSKSSKSSKSGKSSASVEASEELYVPQDQPMEIESAKPSKPPLTTRKSSRQKSKTLSTKPEESKPKPKPKPKSKSSKSSKSGKSSASVEASEELYVPQDVSSNLYVKQYNFRQRKGLKPQAHLDSRPSKPLPNDLYTIDPPPALSEQGLGHILSLALYRCLFGVCELSSSWTNNGLIIKGWSWKVGKDRGKQILDRVYQFRNPYVEDGYIGEEEEREEEEGEEEEVEKEKESVTSVEQEDVSVVETQCDTERDEIMAKKEEEEKRESVESQDSSDTSSSGSDMEVNDFKIQQQLDEDTAERSNNESNTLEESLKQLETQSTLTDDCSNNRKDEKQSPERQSLQTKEQEPPKCVELVNNTPNFFDLLYIRDVIVFLSQSEAIFGSSSISDVIDSIPNDISSTTLQKMENCDNISSFCDAFVSHIHSFDSLFDRILEEKSRRKTEISCEIEKEIERRRVLEAKYRDLKDKEKQNSQSRQPMTCEAISGSIEVLPSDPTIPDPSIDINTKSERDTIVPSILLAHQGTEEEEEEEEEEGVVINSQEHAIQSDSLHSTQIGEGYGHPTNKMDELSSMVVIPIESKETEKETEKEKEEKEEEGKEIDTKDVQDISLLMRELNSLPPLYRSSESILFHLSTLTHTHALSLPFPLLCDVLDPFHMVSDIIIELYPRILLTEDENDQNVDRGTCGVYGDTHSNTAEVREQQKQLSFHGVVKDQSCSDTLVQSSTISSFLTLKDIRDKIIFFLPQFFSLLSSRAAKFDTLLPWINKDIFSALYLFIPVNRDVHWTLIVCVKPGEIVEHWIGKKVQSSTISSFLTLKDIRDKIIFFLPQFFSLLSSRAAKFDTLLPWINKDIFSALYLFIPVNRDVHWTLIVCVKPGEIVEHWIGKKGLDEWREQWKLRKLKRNRTVQSLETPSVEGASEPKDSAISSDTFEWTGDMVSEDTPLSSRVRYFLNSSLSRALCPSILFFDSAEQGLKKGAFHIRTWLNDMVSTVLGQERVWQLVEEENWRKQSIKARELRRQQKKEEEEEEEEEEEKSQDESTDKDVEPVYIGKRRTLSRSLSSSSRRSSSSRYSRTQTTDHSQESQEYETATSNGESQEGCKNDGFSVEFIPSVSSSLTTEPIPLLFSEKDRKKMAPIFIHCLTKHHVFADCVNPLIFPTISMSAASQMNGIDCGLYVGLFERLLLCGGEVGDDWKNHVVKKRERVEKGKKRQKRKYSGSSTSVEPSPKQPNIEQLDELSITDMKAIDFAALLNCIPHHKLPCSDVISRYDSPDSPYCQYPYECPLYHLDSKLPDIIKRYDPFSPENMELENKMVDDAALVLVNEMEATRTAEDTQISPKEEERKKSSAMSKKEGSRNDNIEDIEDVIVNIEYVNDVECCEEKEEEEGEGIEANDDDSSKGKEKEPTKSLKEEEEEGEEGDQMVDISDVAEYLQKKYISEVKKYTYLSPEIHIPDIEDFIGHIITSIFHVKYGFSLDFQQFAKEWWLSAASSNQFLHCVVREFDNLCIKMATNNVVLEESILNVRVDFARRALFDGVATLVTKTLKQEWRTEKIDVIDVDETFSVMKVVVDDDIEIIECD